MKFLITCWPLLAAALSLPAQPVPARLTPRYPLGADAALAFTAHDLGAPAPAETIAVARNGYDFTAAGDDIGGTADQCGFQYQALSGDFDLQTRVQSIDHFSPCAKAALMARETLDPGSPMAAAVATPSLQGSFFESRSVSSNAVLRAGSFPPNPPNTWLRLQRLGSRFTGYASYDGQTWSRLGTATLQLPAALYVGLAVSSHANGLAATARFRDLGPAVSAAEANLVNPSEPLGPSSRRTPIVISEIMYKPAKRADGRNTEFIEIFNSNPWGHDVSGYRLDGQAQYTFPPGTVVPGDGFLVVAAAPADLRSVYGLTNALGPYTNSLKTSGAILLYDEVGALLLNVNYTDRAPWPMGADGTGHSIVLARPSYGEADPRAWDRSDIVGGSPGAFESYRPSPGRDVVINEILARGDDADPDTIELYNHSNTPVDLSGCSLSDDALANRFVIPAHTIIPARGFVAFSRPQLGFDLPAAGATIYFKNPDASRVLDALRFDAQEKGVSFGRYPDGASQWYRLAAQTWGTNNAPPLMSAIGINEIMYQPLSRLDDDQYVELYNRGPLAVNLGGWKFVAGIAFTFPTNAVLTANGYLVVGANSSRLLTHYPQLNLTNTFGNFSGRLSGKGERLALSRPETIVATNSQGAAVTNAMDIVVDEVAYGAGGRWGRWADGGGSSLELTDARADKRLAANWADSDETAKAPWGNIEATGVLDNGGNFDPAIDYAEIGLLDVGECLVDNLEIHPGASTANYVGNPGFENGLDHWTLLGDHSRSSLETNAGYGGTGNALHLRTGDKIWSGVNGAQVMLTNTTLAAGQTATLRFKGRWLHGAPEALFRLSGNWLEATGRLPVPANLGTPGLPNSRALTNAGPAIYEVTHSPSLPSANQPVVVSARVSDPDGVAALTLRYRIDPAPGYTEVEMRDDGAGGDAIADDGVFSATIPGQAAGTVTAFVVTASDSQGATSRFPALLDDNGPDRECLAAFGDPNPPSSFGAYHFWLSQTNVNRWVALPVLSNEEMDGTLVCGNRVIYNASGRYAGSPYHQAFDSPLGNHACHYIWSVPKDDLFLGASSLNKIHWPGNDIQSDTASQNINDATLQREQAANTFLRALGVPWINRRFVAVFVNGHRRGALMEDALRPSVSVPDEYFPNDTGGLLYKIQPWFEFGSAVSGNYAPWANESWCQITPYTTTGGAFKPARYRWTFELRQTPDSYSNFTNVFSLVTAASASTRSNYVSALENLADMENWMRLQAANHVAGDWDCFGVQNGQNIYAWVSPQHRWTTFMFDMNIVLGNNICWGPGQNLLPFNPDPNWARIYNNPVFLRMYWRALKELIGSAMLSTSLNPLVEAKYAAFVADGLNVQGPAAIETWVSQARSSIASQLAAVDAAAFTLTATNLSASANTVVLSGVAPVQVTTISVNGEAFTPVWSSLTAWSLTLPAPFGANTWTVLACDRLGNIVGGAHSVQVANPAHPALPLGSVGFSEIMYYPPLPGAEFVELFNRSTNTTFDLSGWRIDGLGYTFPPGSLLAPGRYLVLAASGVNYAVAFGALTPVFDQFSGTLRTGGETLSLLQPGSSGEVVIDRVRYEATAPWPTGPAVQPGVSLQVIDPAQDHSRVGNWAAGPATPAAPNVVGGRLPSFAPLWLNEAEAENVTGPADNFGEQDPWIEIYNAGGAPLSLAGYYLGANYASPASWAFPTNATIAPGQFLVVWADGQPQQATGAVLHASFRLTPGAGSIALSRYVSNTVQIVDYLNYTGLPANHSYGDTPDGQPFYRQGMFHATPGAPNSAALPPIAVSINEWMAENNGYLLDPATGKYSDWFELYNPGDTPADLGGYYLTDTLSNPFVYQIPAGYQLPAGGFLLVWADGQPSAHTTNSPGLHVSFKLAKAGAALGLFAPDGAAIDAITFGAQTANVSEGRYPDGGPLRLFMPAPSPGAPNLLPPASGPPTVAGFSVGPDGSMTLIFQAELGHTYRVEFKDDLAAPAWTPLGADQFAAASTLTATDAGAANPQRFYRVMLVH